MMGEPVFFVVRKFNDALHFAIEYGDIWHRVTREDRESYVYRHELWGAALDLPLQELTRQYRAGVRLKPKPAPVAVRRLKPLAEILRIKRVHRAANPCGFIQNTDEFYETVEEGK